MAARSPVPTEPIVEKLRNLKSYCPKDTQSPRYDETIYEFGDFLAGRIGSHPTIVPVGFVVATNLALLDLSRGVDGFTRKPISNPLVGMPEIIYAAIEMYTPEIAEATCPPEFAKEVKKAYEEMKAEARKKAASAPVKSA